MSDKWDSEDLDLMREAAANFFATMDSEEAAKNQSELETAQLSNTDGTAQYGKWSVIEIEDQIRFCRNVEKNGQKQILSLTMQESAGRWLVVSVRRDQA